MSSFGVSLPSRQLLIAGSLVVFALVALSFGRVLIVEYRLSLQKEALEAQVLRLAAENRRLEARARYLQTDAGIEELAREELGWTKPGDTAVVVRWSEAAATPAPVRAARPPAAAAGPPVPFWQQLLRPITRRVFGTGQ